MYFSIFIHNEVKFAFTLLKMHMKRLFFVTFVVYLFIYCKQNYIYTQSLQMKINFNEYIRNFIRTAMYQ